MAATAARILVALVLVGVVAGLWILVLVAVATWADTNFGGVAALGAVIAVGGVGLGATGVAIQAVMQKARVRRWFGLA